MKSKAVLIVNREGFMKKIKKMVPYLSAILLLFYVLPLFVFNTGTSILLLLIVTPLVCFVVSMLYGQKNTSIFIFSALVAVLFIPTVFIYYNYTAWVYIFAYGIIALVGSLIGKKLK